MAGTPKFTWRTRLPGVGGVHLHPFHMKEDLKPISSSEVFSLKFLRRWGSAFIAEGDMEVVHDIDEKGLKLISGMEIPILLKQTMKVETEGCSSTLILVSVKSISSRLMIPYHVIHEGIGCAEIPEEYNTIQWWCLLVKGEPTALDDVLQLLGAGGAVGPNMLEDGWEVKSKLKKGSFTTMYKLKSKLAKEPSQLVMKVYDVTGDHPLLLQRHARRELEALAHVQGHRYVVGLYGVFQTSLDGELPAWAVAFEFCGLGNLYDIVLSKQLAEEEVVDLFLGLTAGLEHIHSKGVVHRDVRPHNLFVCSPARAVLGDFHLACFTSETSKLTQPVGMPGYMAPEASTGSPYDVKVDMFGLGVSCFFALCRENPFGISEKEQLQRSQLGAGGLHPDAFVDLSDHFQKFVELLLHVNPRDRPTAREARKHPWLRGQPLLSRPLAPILPRSPRSPRASKGDEGVELAVRRGKSVFLAPLLLTSESSLTSNTSMPGTRSPSPRPEGAHRSPRVGTRMLPLADFGLLSPLAPKVPKERSRHLIRIG